MSISFPKPRSLAAAVVFSLVVGGLALAPATAAVAATTAQNQATVLAEINDARDLASTDEIPVPMLTSSAALTAAAQKYAAASAAKGKSTGAPTSVPVDADAEAGAPVFATTLGILSSKKTAADGFETLDAAIVTNAAYNYVGIGYATKGTKTFVVALVADYETAPQETQFATKPVLAGEVAVGGLLVAKSTFSTGTPDSREYRWLVGGVEDTSFSNSALYPVTAATKGKTIQVVITAKKAGYATLVQSSAKSAKVATGKFPVQVIVEGDRNVGQELEAYPAVGSVFSIVTPTVTFQWYRGSSKITGATDSDYVQVAKDSGKKIWVRVTVKGSGLATVVKDSSKSIITKPKQIEYTSGVSIVLPDGVTQIVPGTVLTVNKGDWLNEAPLPVTTASGIKLSVQWYLGSSAVKGATKDTFTVPTSALGKDVWVKVTGTQKNYGTTVRTSMQHFVYGTDFTESPSLAVVGTFAKGKTLTAKITDLPAGAKVSYEWYSITSIFLQKPASTSKSYKLSTSVANGHIVILQVRITKPGYNPITLQQFATDLEGIGIG